MKAFSLRVIALASLPAFGACADVASPTEEPQGLKIAVAPLQLTGIGDACYNILVENNAGGTGEGENYVPLPFSQTGATAGDGNDVVRLVAENGAICSGVYGNGTGGDITYIAPCDASSDTVAGGTVQNSVTIWPFLKASVGGSVLTDWTNPCDTTPGGTVEGCQLHFDCNANSDTLVEFNFTIMRDAQQGFFDVAVNFEDIFCSAKFDSCYGTATAVGCADPLNNIELLFGDSGRNHTAVVAFACTAGAGKQTDLLVGDPRVKCGDDVIELDLNVDGNETTDAVNGKTVDYAVYRGSESLTCGTNAQGQPISCGKAYLNYAINLDKLEGYGNCTLEVNNATAVERGANLDFGAAFSSYPVIQYGGHLAAGVGVSLVTGGASQSFAFPLNVANSQVRTSYVSAPPFPNGFVRYQGN